MKLKVRGMSVKIGTNLGIGKSPILKGYKENVPSWVELKRLPIPNLGTMPFSRLLNRVANMSGTLRGVKGYYTFAGVFKPKKPWICGIAHASNLHVKSLVQTDRILTNKNCKKILARSCAVKKGLKLFDYDKFKDKVEVVYPSIIDSGVIRTKFEKKTINLLFVTKGTFSDGLNKFHAKGGKEVLKAFETLCKRYDLHLTMVGMVPPEILRKYRNYKDITFLRSTKKPEYLYRHLYPAADIYVMPTSIDTFGFVFLEAMNYGLPILASNCFAAPEIVEDGRGGFLIEPEFSQFEQKIDIHNIDPKNFYNHTKYFEYYNKIRKTEVPQIIEKLSILTEDSKMRRRMSRHNKKLISEGKFSTKHQQHQLGRIFEESFSV